MTPINLEIRNYIRKMQRIKGAMLNPLKPRNSTTLLKGTLNCSMLLRRCRYLLFLYSATSSRDDYHSLRGLMFLTYVKHISFYVQN